MGETIYHYTSLEAAQKILETGTLWATHISYMNDTQEFNQCIDVLAGDAPEELRLSLLATFRKEVTSGEIYVACFSRSKDDLNQWRSYGGGRVGVAIGFDESELKNCGAGTTKFTVQQCLYELAEHRALLKPLLDQMHALVAKPLPLPADDPYAIDGRRRHKSIQGFSDYVLPLSLPPVAPQIKSRQFSAEQEVRLIVSDKSSQQNLDRGYRLGMGGASMVPYVKLDCARVLREVWIGPGPYMSHAKRGMEHLLSVVGRDLPVHRSGVPFRGWG